MLDDETFWVALGAVSTAVSVTVALFLPFYIARLNEEKARILVARELHENMKKIRAISKLDDQASTIFQMGLNQNILIEEYKKHLSLTHWAYFKFQMRRDHYICFEKLVSRIDYIKNFNGAPGAIYHVSVNEAKSLVQEYEIISKRCRYLKI